MDDSDGDLLNGIERMNERVHATTFARETTEDQKIVEHCTAQEFRISVRDKYGLVVDSITSNPVPNGVPDCFADCNGESVSLELTELVDSQLLDQICDARMQGRVVTSYSGEGFQNALWDEQRFARALSDRLEAKKTKYQKNNNVVDVLIIHTDETWLSPFQVEEWLPRCKLAPSQHVRSAYLLMTYSPGYSDHWPVFRIC